MKRLSLLLVLLLALALTACGGAQTDVVPDEAADVVEEAPEVVEDAAEAAAADAEAVEEEVVEEAQAPTATGNLLQTVLDRGELICGVNSTLPGFGNVDAEGNFSGFDVDYCRALAAAIFDDPNAVEFRPLTAQERFTAVQTGEVDVLIRNTTETLSRDTEVGLDFAPITFYDGQGLMVREGSGIETIEDLAGATICVQSGTTTELNLADQFRARDVPFEPLVFNENDQVVAAYDAGQCDAFTTDKSGLVSSRTKLTNPEEHVILDVTLSKEPLGPSVLQGDPQWLDVVEWVTLVPVQAEEFGITSENVDEFLTSENPDIRRFLGVEGGLGAMLGLEEGFAERVIRAVGNYEEIYNRNLGPETAFELPRGLNALYTEGGLQYSPPFR